MNRRIVLNAMLMAMLLLNATFAQEKVADQWTFTLEKPADGWFKADFGDANWQQGFGGFGTRGTPNARVGTEWRSNDIWLRKQFDLKAIPVTPALYIHHDEDAQVYLNGKLLVELKRWTTEYQVIKFDQSQASLLKVGTNVLAIHCHQSDGGQFIDAHLIDANKVPELPRPARDLTPFKSELITRWGAEVNADNAWTEYPRPQLVRPSWTNLNGRWDYAITADDATKEPEVWTGKILIPFCLESKLGGVQRMLEYNEALWYHRTFDVAKKSGERLLLNFEAVDYLSDVYVNDQHVGSHQGGNTPFSFDITDAIREGTNKLVVKVQDDTQEWQLNGKQSLEPNGIWYTQVSGIWQTVWLESRPTIAIDDVKIETSAAEGTISVSLENTGNAPSFKVVAIMEGQSVAESTAKNDGVAQLKIPNVQLWSPDSPSLYELEISLLSDNGEVLDQVRSYAGVRSVGKTRDIQGNLRFTLNDQVLFHWGPLDQGWWPDGLLTPPSDEAMLFDIEFLKQAGFNMIRKHIKVEPRRYYYHCDRLGMLVWQDQVSGGRGAPWTHLDENPQDAEWPANAHQQFMVEFEQMIDNLENHPSIVVWTPFNEAWGQHQTMEVGKWAVERDRSRLINIASGGNFWPIGDVVDQHAYPHPSFPFNKERYQDFVQVVGEFGGHGLPVKGHLWDSSRDNWGYGGLPKDANEYKNRYVKSIEILNELRQQGIAAGVYTQTTDVEGEINGLMTYDRKVIKIPADELAKLHKRLYAK